MKLSIITVNYNDAKGLQRTIESVLCQTFHDYEFIVIDGGSTDGSVEVRNMKSISIAGFLSKMEEFTQE